MIYTCCAQETLMLGRQLGKELKRGDILCLTGDLGAGKTTFIKGLARGACDFPEREVTSPTFSYLHIYEGIFPLYHFDLYRLNGEEDFRALGFQEYLEGDGICCIEWAEKISGLLPKRARFAHMSYEGEEKRKIIWDLSRTKPSSVLT